MYVGIYVCMYYVCIYVPTYLSQCVLPIFSWTCGLPLEFGKLNILLMSMFISCPQLLSDPPLPPETSTSYSLSHSLFLIHLIQFVLVNYSWALRLTWSMVNIPNALSLRETDFSSLRSNQMPLAPQLGMGLHAPLSPPPWDFVWLKHVQVLCMLSQ